MGNRKLGKVRASLVVVAVAGVVMAACASDNSTSNAPAATAAPVSGSSTATAGSAASSSEPDPATTVDPGTTAAAASDPASDTSLEDTIPPDSGPIDTSTTVAERPIVAGATRMHFEVGPIDVQPGQNNIDFSKGKVPKPEADGYITRIAPNIRLADGSIPGVDVIHLHHGVWLNTSAPDATNGGAERFFAAGEEKTTTLLPTGYGYPFHAGDNWIINYMIHNLYPIDQQVWITYDIDFIPATDPAAAGIVAARPIWTDVQNGSIYPVFDVIKGSGSNGEYTYPADADDPYAGGPAKNSWTVDRDGVLLTTAGHLHPGGLHNDLWLERGGTTAHLFESVAHYWEPAGAVSWDVAMSATPETWRVAVHAGDVLSTSATYDSARASWYESMGIMVAWMADAQAPGEAAAPDPFATPVDVAGQLTHGHLAENDNHGGAADVSYLNALDQPSEPAKAEIPIEGYIYGQGDMLAGDAIPTIAPGGTITFDNIDAPLNNGVWHTITSCKAPCNESTGIAYPLADADIPFDSGQLGAVGPPTAGRVTWSTPTDLPDGTYTYFCRIHPAMRGAFRVADEP
jgi:plastocyanin